MCRASGASKRSTGRPKAEGRVIGGVQVLFGLPLRQTTGFATSLLKLAGLDWPVPDFSTLCRRQRTLAVQLPYRGSGGPLHLLVDSTGIKVRGEGEWPKMGCKLRGCRNQLLTKARYGRLARGTSQRRIDGHVGFLRFAAVRPGRSERRLSALTIRSSRSALTGLPPRWPSWRRSFP